LIEGGIEMGYDNLDANAAQQTGVVLNNVRADSI
jgi:lactate dehydrogenase-like 2-hydroxyacid dehydrogenase